MIDPSGKFWIAMPIARVIADAVVEELQNTLASATPTAMPSGMLWMLIARNIKLFCFSGTILSIANKKRNPASKPILAGIQESWFKCAELLIAGINKDHIDAASIIPAEKPVIKECVFLLMWFVEKNTRPAPRVVPKNGIVKPKNNSNIKNPQNYA